MSLPEVLRFEDLGGVSSGQRCFYEKVGFRAPWKNEWYVSGAEPMAYRAKTDHMTMTYQIVKPTRYAIRAVGLVPGEFVRL